MEEEYCNSSDNLQEWLLYCHNKQGTANLCIVLT